MDESQLEIWLRRYNETVEAYHDMKFDDKYKATELMKDMAVILSYLTMERIEYKKQWNAAYLENKANTSATAAEKLADIQVQEMYQLRRIHDVGKSILDTMRSQVSLLKQES